MGRCVLRLERQRPRAVPNISLKVAPATPDALLLEAVATALDSLVNDPSVRTRCAQVASMLAAERPGTVVAADAVLALASRAGL